MVSAIGPVTIGAGSTLEVRAGVAGNTVLEADAYLTALSYLPRDERVPRGERWDGIPAKPAGHADSAPLSKARSALSVAAGSVK